MLRNAVRPLGRSRRQTLGIGISHTTSVMFHFSSPAMSNNSQPMAIQYPAERRLYMEPKMAHVPRRCTATSLHKVRPSYSGDPSPRPMLRMANPENIHTLKRFPHPKGTEISGYHITPARGVSQGRMVVSWNAVAYVWWPKKPMIQQANVFFRS